MLIPAARDSLHKRLTSCALGALLIAGCATAPAPSPGTTAPAPVSPSEEDPFSFVTASPRRAGQNVTGGVIASASRVVLRYAQLVAGPNPRNKFERGEWIVLTAEPLPETTIAAERAREWVYSQPFAVIIEQPTASGARSLSITGTSAKPVTLPLDTLEVKRTSEGFVGRIKPAVTPAAAGEAGVPLVRAEFTSREFKTFAVPTAPMFTGAPKPLGKSGDAPGQAYVAYCRQNAEIFPTEAEFEQNLRRKGDLPTQEELDLIAKQLGHKIEMKEAIARMYRRHLDDVNRKPVACRILDGQSDGQLAQLTVEARLQGRVEKFTAWLSRKGTRWAVVEHSRWIPLDK